MFADELSSLIPWLNTGFHFLFVWNISVENQLDCQTSLWSDLSTDLLDQMSDCPENFLFRVRLIRLTPITVCKVRILSLHMFSKILI